VYRAGDRLDGGRRGDGDGLVLWSFGGKGQTTGLPGGGGTLAMSSPRSRVEGRARGQALINGGRGKGFFPVKVLRFDTSVGHALRVSLISWGRCCGYLLRVRAPGENP
jgi:hypothetical protein